MHALIQLTSVTGIEAPLFPSVKAQGANRRPRIVAKRDDSFDSVVCECNCDCDCQCNCDCPDCACDCHGD